MKSQRLKNLCLIASLVFTILAFGQEDITFGYLEGKITSIEDRTATVRLSSGDEIEAELGLPGGQFFASV